MRTKKFLSVVLSAVMCLSLLPTISLSVAAEDTCTSHSYTNGFCIDCDSYQPAVLNESGYYEIGNAGQLYWFAEKVNNDNANYKCANAILTDNITVNKNVLVNGVLNTDEEVVKAFRDWTPIGKDDSNYYDGTFEGNGKTVSGLYFNDGNAFNVGLFGVIGNIETLSTIVRNVSVVDSYFYGYFYVGGVVGSGSGKITGCHNAAYVSGFGFVGGIMGFTPDVTIENCYNTGTVTATNYVGGVIGLFQAGTVKSCYNTGTVNAQMDYVGGVVGDFNGNGTATNCYYLSGSCTSAGGGTAKTAEQFASGEVAYLLGDAWGQAIGIDSYPVLGGIKVISENGTYKNQVTEFEIISLGEDKKSANVAIPKKGTYTLILADYEESRLNNLDTITVVAENDNTIKTVKAEKDITLGTGDKIMLWSNMTTLARVCKAYIVE